MPSLRIATFNCENLMMRCDFSRAGIRDARSRLTAITDAAEADRVDAAFDVLSEDDRTLTAQALVQARAEVCALQEVENLVTLTAFDTRYVSRWAGRPYGERVLYEGNDARGIDVALLSRLPVVASRSHAHETWASLGLSPPAGRRATERAFRRDLLEVDIVKDGRVLALFVCHLKSMHGGRQQTRAIRAAELQAARVIISRRFGTPEAAEWVLLGDFNDYAERDGRTLSDHGLGPLIDDGFAVDLGRQVINDPADRWTHHYAGDDTYGALDHIFLSPRLAAFNEGTTATCIRAGAPYRAARHRGFRFPGIGWSNPKASDHCPLAAVIEFEGRPYPS